MAERRTKEEKYQAEQRRLEQFEERHSLADADTMSFAAVGRDEINDGASDLLVYSQDLIKKDLRRTMFATALVFMILVALYFSF